jgi:hypothetical protein
MKHWLWCLISSHVIICRINCRICAGCLLPNTFRSWASSRRSQEAEEEARADCWWAFWFSVSRRGVYTPGSVNLRSSSYHFTHLIVYGGVWNVVTSKLSVDWIDAERSALSHFVEKSCTEGNKIVLVVELQCEDESEGQYRGTNQNQIKISLTPV